jgi:antitoxin component YwqK of YwqJK toxin-antitoxin module
MINNLIKILLLFLIISSVSCKKKHIDNHDNGNVWKEYYEKNGELTGAYKEYFTNGKLKLTHDFNKGVNIDTSFYYYKSPVERIQFKRFWANNDSIKQIEFYQNGTIKKEGIVDNNFLKYGNWRFYDKNERLDIIREYRIINNEQYLNQEWNINKNKDTLFKGSKYIEIQIAEDTIIIGNPIQAIAYLKAELFKDKSSEIFVCLPNGESVNFNKDFSNLKEIKLDTFYNLQHDLKNKNIFNDGFNKQHTAVFGKWFKNSTGLKNIRGFVEEYYPIDSNGFKQNKTFFEFQVYVKDTVDNNPN